MANLNSLLADLSREPLSPPAAATIGTLTSAVSRFGGAISASNFKDAVDAAVGAVPAVAAFAAGPLVGGIVGAAVGIFQAVGWAGGTGPAATSRAERAAWCKAVHTYPVGSGPGNEVRPSDWFAPGVNGFADTATYYPNLGKALRWLTESESESIVAFFSSLPASTANLMLPRYSKQLGRPVTSLGGAKGISAARSSLYKRLIDQIAAQHKAKNTDGGIALGLVLADLLRADFEARRFTPELAALIIDLKSHPMNTEVAEPGEVTCLDNDPRPLRDVLAIVDGWTKTVRPNYGASASLGGILGAPPARHRPSILGFVLGTAAVGALGLGIARPALALAAARKAAGLARRAGGAVRSVVTRGAR